MQFFFTFPLRLNTIEISCNILHQWMLSPDRNSMAFFFIIQILFKLLFPKMSLGASFTRGQPRKGASCNSCYIPWCRVGIPLRTQFGRKYFEIELMFFFSSMETWTFHVLYSYMWIEKNLNWWNRNSNNIVIMQLFLQELFIFSINMKCVVCACRACAQMITFFSFLFFSKVSWIDVVLLQYSLCQALPATLEQQ